MALLYSSAKTKIFSLYPTKSSCYSFRPLCFWSAYLLLIEDRRTHTCHPSYNTIAAATGVSKNTAMKSIGTLLEMGLITTEPSSYFDKRGMKWKGNNLYTILPIGVAMDAFCQRQLRHLEESVTRQEADAKLSRLCMAQEPPAPMGQPQHP